MAKSNKSIATTTSEEQVVDNTPNYQALVKEIVKTTSWEEVFQKLTTEPVQDSKMSKAKTIYAELIAAGKVRKDIISEFKTKLEMTNAGASTYYQKIKQAK